MSVFDFSNLLNEIANLTPANAMTLDDNDNTYLHHVVTYPNKDTANIVRRLMRQHVIVDHQNIFGQTVFQLAARNCTSEILEILFNEPADFFSHSQEIDLDDVHGNTLAHYANADNIETISQYDFNLNKKNNNGHTPLIDAAIKKDVNKVIALLEWGANPNITDREGNTVIHHSILVAHENLEDFNQILQKMIEIRSCKFTQTNRYGNTVLDIAIQSNMMEATQLIWKTWTFLPRHLERWLSSVGAINSSMRDLLKTLSESHTSFRARYA